jgi:hypothetical protein
VELLVAYLEWMMDTDTWAVIGIDGRLWFSPVYCGGLFPVTMMVPRNWKGSVVGKVHTVLERAWLGLNVPDRLTGRYYR